MMGKMLMRYDENHESFRFSLLFCLLSPLHHLCAHLHQAGFRLRVWEECNGINGFIDVFLSQGAGLFETCALRDDLASLEMSAWVICCTFPSPFPDRERIM